MKIKLNWKVAIKPERRVTQAASHYTFKNCTSKC